MEIGDSGAGDGSHHTKTIVPAPDLRETFSAIFDEPPDDGMHGGGYNVVAVRSERRPGHADIRDAQARLAQERVGGRPGALARGLVGGSEGSNLRRALLPADGGIRWKWRALHDRRSSRG